MSPLEALRLLVDAVRAGAGVETAVTTAEETLARVEAIGPCEFPGDMLLIDACPECGHRLNNHRHPDKVCQQCLREGRRTEIDATERTG